MAEVEARRTFGPVVLLGLASSGFAAVAGHNGMLEVSSEFLTSSGMASFEGQDASAVEFPLAGALALVSLACWGVLLVTRGVVRRVVAVTAGLAAAGILAVVVVGGFIQDDDAATDLGERLGTTTFATLDLERTPWLWVCLAAALVAMAAASAAVVFVREWPEMGSRYDAPSAPAATVVSDPAEQSNLDLWKSIDEGTDPTAD